MLGRVKKPNRALNPEALQSTHNPLLDDLLDNLNASALTLAGASATKSAGSKGDGSGGSSDAINDAGSCSPILKEGNDDFNNLTYNHGWGMDFDSKVKSDGNLFHVSASDGGAGSTAMEAVKQAAQHFQLAMHRHNMGGFFSAKDSAAKVAKARELLKKMDVNDMHTLILALVDILEDVHLEREKIAKMCGEYEDMCKEAQLSSSMLSTMSIASMARSPVHETHQVAMSRNDEGNVMINRYTILANLGHGAYGQVKLAEEADTGRKVAIKIISKKLLKRRINCSAAESENALNREIAIMKKVRHQNCVSLYEVIDDPGSNKLYLIMDYIANGPVVRVQTQILPPMFLHDLEEQKLITGVLYNRYLLRCALSHNADSGNIALSATEMDKPASLFLCRPINEVVCAYYLRQLVSGLRYMHKRNVVHHDIKPDNILLGNEHRIFLTDFGVSEIMETTADAGSEEEYNSDRDDAGARSRSGRSSDSDDNFGQSKSSTNDSSRISSNHAGKNDCEQVDFKRSASSKGTGRLSSDAQGSTGKAGKPGQGSGVTKRKTRARLGAGTLLFTAPELLDSSLRPEEIDPFATDVWAMGVTLYCMLIGCAPFHGSCYADITRNIKTQSIPWNGMNVYSQPVLPHWFVVLQGLLEKNPAKRWLLVDLKKYLDADEFQHALELVEQTKQRGDLSAQGQQTQPQQSSQVRSSPCPPISSTMSSTPALGANAMPSLHRPSLTTSDVSSSSAATFSISSYIQTFPSVDLSLYGNARLEAPESSTQAATGAALLSNVRRIPGRGPDAVLHEIRFSSSLCSAPSTASAAAFATPMTLCSISSSFARRRRQSAIGPDTVLTLVPTDKEMREARRLQTGQFLTRRYTTLSVGARLIVRAFVQRIRRRLAVRNPYIHASWPPTYPVPLNGDTANPQANRQHSSMTIDVRHSDDNNHKHYSRSSNVIRESDSDSPAMRNPSLSSSRGRASSKHNDNKCAGQAHSVDEDDVDEISGSETAAATAIPSSCTTPDKDWSKRRGVARGARELSGPAVKSTRDRTNPPRHLVEAPSPAETPGRNFSRRHTNIHKDEASRGYDGHDDDTNHGRYERQGGTRSRANANPAAMHDCLNDLHTHASASEEDHVVLQCSKSFSTSSVRAPAPPSDSNVNIHPTTAHQNRSYASLSHVMEDKSALSTNSLPESTVMMIPAAASRELMLGTSNVSQSWTHAGSAANVDSVQMSHSPVQHQSEGATCSTNSNNNSVKKKLKNASGARSQQLHTASTTPGKSPSSMPSSITSAEELVSVAEPPPPPPSMLASVPTTHRTQRRISQSFKSLGAGNISSMMTPNQSCSAPAAPSLRMNLAKGTEDNKNDKEANRTTVEACEMGSRPSSANANSISSLANTALHTVPLTGAKVASMVRDCGSSSLDAFLSIVNLPSMSILSSTSNTLMSNLSHDLWPGQNATTPTGQQQHRRESVPSRKGSKASLSGHENNRTEMASTAMQATPMQKNSNNALHIPSATTNTVTTKVRQSSSDEVAWDTKSGQPGQQSDAHAPVGRDAMYTNHTPTSNNRYASSYMSSVDGINEEDFYSSITHTNSEHDAGGSTGTSHTSTKVATPTSVNAPQQSIGKTGAVKATATAPNAEEGDGYALHSNSSGLSSNSRQAAKVAATGQRRSSANPLNWKAAITRTPELSKRLSRMPFKLNARDVSERLAPEHYSEPLALRSDSDDTVSQNSLSALARKRLGPLASPTVQQNSQRALEGNKPLGHVSRGRDARSRATGASASSGAKAGKTPSVLPVVKHSSGAKVRQHQTIFSATQVGNSRTRNK